MKKTDNTVHMNKQDANNGTDDKVNDTPVSRPRFAPIQRADEADLALYEAFKAMTVEVEPTLKTFKQNLCSIESISEIKKIQSRFHTLINLYGEWDDITDSDCGLTVEERVEEYGGPERVENVRKTMISTENEIAEFLPNQEDYWREVCELCEINVYVREKIGEIISTRVKNEIDADWVEKSLNNEIYRSGDANDTEDRIANLVTSLSNEECACLYEHYESFYALQDDMQSEFERARYDLDIDCPYEIVRAIEESEEPTQEITKILQNHDSFEALETDSEQWDYELHNEIYKCLVTRMGRPNETIDRHLTETPLALIQFALNCKTISDSLNRDVDPSILNKALRENQEYLSEFSEYRYISDANKRDALREYVCERLWIESPYQELRKKRDLDADSAKPQAA